MSRGVLHVGRNAVGIIPSTASRTVGGGEVEDGGVELDVRIENLAAADSIGSGGESNRGVRVRPAVIYVVAGVIAEARIAGGRNVSTKPLAKHHHVVVVARALGIANRAARRCRQAGTFIEREVSTAILDRLPALPRAGDRREFRAPIDGIAAIALVVDHRTRRPPKAVAVRIARSDVTSRVRKVANA